MKKLILLISLLLISTTCTFASSDSYDAQLQQLKDAKSAKDTVINAQIKALTNEVEKLTLDESVSVSDKNAKIEKYTLQIQDLKNKKSAIREQYQKDKAKLDK